MIISFLAASAISYCSRVTTSEDMNICGEKSVLDRLGGLDLLPVD
jgi:hypothetical protein